MFQIRQEKPYYIADPEVDSLVSTKYLILITLNSINAVIFKAQSSKVLIFALNTVKLSRTRNELVSVS